MTHPNAQAIENLRDYFKANSVQADFDDFLKDLSAAAAAPERIDNAQTLMHIFPDADDSLLELMREARDILRENIQSLILNPARSADRLQALRGQMQKEGFDAFIIPLNDEFHGEAAPAASERLKWLTGFTGSAGLAAVTKDQAAIFVDGRYTLQVRNEVDVNLFTPRHVSEEPLTAWLENLLTAGDVLAIDPWLHTMSSAANLRAFAEKRGFIYKEAEDNPIDVIWQDRPEEPFALIVPHEERYTGQSSKEKRTLIAGKLQELGADASIHTLPDVSAWLLNLRGADLPSTPFALGFTILSADGTADAYFPEKKVTPELSLQFGNEIKLHDRSDFEQGLKSLGGKRVLLDPTTTSQRIATLLSEAGAQLLKADDPCMLPKSTKNTVELEGTRLAHIRDGVAVTKFLHWLDQETPKGTVDELKAEQTLRDFRREGDHFKDLSFSTISGSGPNGAIVHYRATEASNRPLEMGSLYLVDSGGQYLDGTTDITRTIAIGTPSQEMKERFTLVLKGHIALAEAAFPVGTTGSQLDTLARLPLWKQGLDYDHGTGHGVGSYLSVHEGPQRISKMPNPVALEPGMILSNEPGYYKTGEYGIRIENLVAVRKIPARNGMERETLGFETLTFAPIDQRLIDISLMTKEERQWINSYHQQVWDKISPLVSGDVKDWLKQATKQTS
ncbi:MAG: aminopeptidase P family protein [Sneathiellales bacterium]|nr:aminopeptidase P family protein [Sneathiellales bacterium]